MVNEMDIFVVSLIWSGSFEAITRGWRASSSLPRKSRWKVCPLETDMSVVKFWGQCGNSKSGMFFAQQSSSELVIQGIKIKIWAPTSCIVHHCPTSHPKSQHDQLLQSRANVFYHVVAILTPKSPFLLMAGIYQPSPNGWMIPILWVTI